MKKLLAIIGLCLILNIKSYALDIKTKFELGQGLNSQTSTSNINITFKYNILNNHYINMFGGWRTWHETELNNILPFVHGHPFRDIYKLGMFYQYDLIQLKYFHYCSHGVHSSKNQEEISFRENYDLLLINLTHNIKNILYFNYGFGMTIYEYSMFYFEINFKISVLKYKFMTLYLGNKYSYIFERGLQNLLYFDLENLVENKKFHIRISYLYNDRIQKNISQWEKEKSGRIIFDEIKWYSEYPMHKIFILSFIIEY